MADVLKAISIGHGLTILALILTGAAMFYNVKAHAERNEQGYKAGDARLGENCELRFKHINANVKEIKETLNKISEKI